MYNNTHKQQQQTKTAYYKTINIQCISLNHQMSRVLKNKEKQTGNI